MASIRFSPADYVAPLSAPVCQHDQVAVLGDADVTAMVIGTVVMAVWLAASGVSTSAGQDVVPSARWQIANAPPEAPALAHRPLSGDLR